MLDDADVKKITDHMAVERKERNKKESRDLLFIVFGLMIGMLIVAFVAVAAGPMEKTNYLADREILEIQNLSCFDLKHFTPKFANPNFVVLELLQRCY